MMHDFAVTERHVVFLDLPVVYDLEPRRQAAVPREMEARGRGAHRGDASRCAAAPRWFDVEPSYVFHTVNAYDEDERSCSTSYATSRCSPMIARLVGRDRDARPVDDRPRAGRVREERIDDRTQEFPRVDERVLGRRHRYAYVSTSDMKDFERPFGTLLRHDLQSGTTTTAKLGPGMQAGERIFVPAGAEAAEDEGWVLSVVYNTPEDRSDLVIMDATRFGGTPVATVALPQRVPFGFHGIWEPAP